MENEEFGIAPQPVGQEIPDTDAGAAPDDAQDAQPAEAVPARKTPFARFKGSFGRRWENPKGGNWFARHKKLTVLLVIVVIAAVVINRMMAAAVPASGTTYQYVRTTTLTKTSLEDSVTVSGTVASGSEASVTVADNAKTYKVASVEVEVGDEVQAGDVICTLDTSDLEKQIESAELSYNDTLQSAQTTYDRALESYEVAAVKHENNLIDLQENITKADENLTKAQENLDSAKSSRDSAQNTVNSCQNTVNSLQSAYNAAQGISSYVSSYDMAADALNNAAAALDSAYQNYTTAYMNYTGAADKEAAKPALEQAVRALQSAWDAYGSGTIDTTTNASISATNQRTVTGTIANMESAKTQVKDAGLNVQLTDPTSTALIDTFNTAASALLTQEGAVTSGTGMTYQQVIDTYNQAQSQLAAAKSALTQAETAITTAQTQVETAESQVESAHDAYDTEKNSTTLTTAWQQVEDAETRLEQAKRVPDTLQTLRDTLEDCTLTATMSGTITELNVTVGSACTGTVATIQNTDGLTVEVTISANDVADVKTGMECYITSDSTGDTRIKGTLTQIDPVANEQGTFGAKVKVDTADSGLLIGIQAQVEILKSVTDNVFVVPIDAVATAEDGSSYVYRKTGGEGVDMTFEQVTVTTGESNDYYVEISGDDLAEGDVIRSTADLSEGIDTATIDTDSQMMVTMGGMDGVPAEASAQMPAGGGEGGRGGGAVAVAPGGGM